MTSFDERLEVLAQRRVDEAIADTLDTLSAGNLPTHADYKYHTGIIAGLRMAKTFLEQALADVQKG